MPNALVIHHNDPDGRMGGYIMMKYFLNKGFTVGTIEADYDMEFNFEKLLTPEDTVCIVDFSLKNGVMKQLLQIVSSDNVIWIDHHKSAIENCKEGESLDGFRYNGISGCELAWLYANGYRQRKTEFAVKVVTNDLSIEKIENIEIPYGVKLIGDYDCWRKQIAESEDFIVGLESHWNELTMDNKDGDKVWDAILNSDMEVIKTLISDGKIIRRYIDTMNDKAIKSRGFEVKLHKFEQYKCIAINSDTPNSWIFNSVFDNYHIGIVFRYNEKTKPTMTFSIYRLGLDKEREIDCSKIAFSYGGGGHPGASGFSTSGTLPFVR